MAHESNHFFIIGLPRSRTAWLSALLTGGNTHCLHDGSDARGVEGVRDAFEPFEGKVDRLGMSDSGLIFHAEELASAYPKAKFLVIDRDPAEVLQSIEKSHPQEPGWQRNWPHVLEKWPLKLPEERTRRIAFADLESLEILQPALAWLLGNPPPLRRIKLFQKLRITQHKKHFKPKPDPPEPLAVTVRWSDEFDFNGLTVHYFSAANDAAKFVEWAESHGVEDARKILPFLPPLGITVCDQYGPCAMVFCRESFGCPVAEIEYPVTRQGMTLAQSSASLALGVAACIDLAGKCCDPPAKYSLFRMTCRESLGRFAERLGFKSCGQKAEKYTFFPWQQ